jgi:hypothetical protein
MTDIITLVFASGKQYEVAREYLEASTTLKMIVERSESKRIVIPRMHQPFKEAVLPHLLGYSLAKRNVNVWGGQDEIDWYGLDRWPYFFDEDDNVLPVPKLVVIALEACELKPDIVWDDMQAVKTEAVALGHDTFYRFEVRSNAGGREVAIPDFSFDEPLYDRMNRMWADSANYFLDRNPILRELLEVDARTRQKVAEMRAGLP